MTFALHWARLRFGGSPKRWHLVDGGSLYSLCGRASFDYPRIERLEGLDTPKRACKFCVAIGLKQAAAP